MAIPKGIFQFKHFYWFLIEIEYKNDKLMTIESKKGWTSGDNNKKTKNLNCYAKMGHTQAQIMFLRQLQANYSFVIRIKNRRVISISSISPDQQRKKKENNQFWKDICILEPMKIAVCTSQQTCLLFSFHCMISIIFILLLCVDSVCSRYLILKLMIIKYFVLQTIFIVNGFRAGR